ncbi:class I SAM-dependent methyltransferase [Novipirellula sp. SH528]|uniref:class I SAM-dependent methyltransferase n=1 Tax=Novipirellula sp. SH528 TaxID=3454466 RepID=UPI003FA05627
MESTVIDAYSRLAREYESEHSGTSCWSRSANQIFREVQKRLSRMTYGSIVDVGCGTGAMLRRLAEELAHPVDLIGVEPASNLRIRAQDVNAKFPNVQILDGRFERLPLPDSSADYLYSIHSFHWTTAPELSAQELARVLGASGDLDLFFAGRGTGRNFIKETTPLFLKHLGANRLVKAAKLRCQMNQKEAEEIFSKAFPEKNVTVTQTTDTFYDTVEGHMNWWVRFEGQLCGVPNEIVEECRCSMENAIRKLATPKGVPYPIELLHVRVDSGSPEWTVV